MVNSKLFLSKFSKIPEILKSQWHQITHRSSLILVEDVTKLFPNIFNEEILLAKLHWRFGHVYSNETLIFLCLLVKAMKAKVVFEFGTFTGRTTYNLALNLPDNGVVYTIDSGIGEDHSNIESRGYESYVVGECFRSAKDRIRKKIVQYISDSRNFNFDHLQGKVDLVFVDGGHDYDTVVSDSYNALKMVKRGGNCMGRLFSILAWRRAGP